MGKLKRIIAFIDSKKAKVFYKKNDEIISEIIESPITHKDEKIPGKGKDVYKFSPRHASNSENKKHNQRINRELQYFRKLEDTLKNFDVIYLTGQGKLKNKVNNLLNENKKFAGKAIFIESADNHLTERQVAARTRKLLF